MTFILTGLMALGVGVFSFRIHKTLLTPWAVYCIAWLAMIGIHSLGWIRFNTLGVSTWLMIWGSMGTFSLGALIAILSSGKGAALILPPPEVWFANVSMRRFGTAQLILSLIGVVGSIGYFRSVDQIIGVHELLDNPGVVRGVESDDEYVAAFFWWKFAFYLNWLSVPIAAARIAYQRSGTPIWVYFAFGFHLLVNLVLVSRGHLLLVLFLLAFVLSAALSLRKRRLEPVIVCGLVIAIIFYFVVRGEALGKSYDYIITSSGGFYGPRELEPISGMYLYVAGNLPGFEAYVNNNSGNHTLGLFQILPLSKLIEKSGIVNLDTPNEVGDFYSIPMRFNTYTYLNVFFKDWGWFGVIICPFMFGYFSNRMFAKACRGGSVWQILGLAVVTHAALSSIGTNVLISTPQWEFALCLVVLAAVTRKRKSVPLPELSEVKGNGN